MKKISTLAAVVVLAGCMGHIIPKPENKYDVIAEAYTADNALGTAIRTAKSTCEEQKKRHIVHHHNTLYQGMLSEGFYNALYDAGLWAADNYKVTMEFSCE